MVVLVEYGIEADTHVTTVGLVASAGQKDLL